MYVCMYVWMFVCMYVCMYVSMYVCMCVCMYVGMSVRMYVFMYSMKMVWLQDPNQQFSWRICDRWSHRATGKQKFAEMSRSRKLPEASCLRSLDWDNLLRTFSGSRIDSESCKNQAGILSRLGVDIWQVVLRGIWKPVLAKAAIVAVKDLLDDIAHLISPNWDRRVRSPYRSPYRSARMPPQTPRKLTQRVRHSGWAGRTQRSQVATRWHPRGIQETPRKHPVCTGSSGLNGGIQTRARETPNPRITQEAKAIQKTKYLQTSKAF